MDTMDRTSLKAIIKGEEIYKDQTQMLQAHSGMELHHFSATTVVVGDIEPLNALCL